MSPSPAALHLRRLMRYHQLNARHVADHLGLKPQTVRAWLCGARSVPDRQFARIKRKWTTSYRVAS